MATSLGPRRPQAAYLVLGLWVGLFLDGPLRGRTAVSSVLASAVGLVLACAVLGWALAALTSIDGMTAYPATTPGGIESVAIVAPGYRDALLGLRSRCCCGCWPAPPLALGRCVVSSCSREDPGACAPQGPTAVLLLPLPALARSPPDGPTPWLRCAPLPVSGVLSLR